MNVTAKQLAAFESLTRLYGILSRINQMMTRSQDFRAFLDDVCRVLVEYGDFKLCWIGFVEPEDRTVKVVTKYGEAVKYLDGIDISIDDVQEGRGPTGTAIRENRYFTSSDIAEDPRMLPWRDKAEKFGLKSSAAFPLTMEDKAIGAISLYASHPKHFNANEIRLLGEIAESVSYGIRNIEREQRAKKVLRKLAESEHRLKHERDKAQQYLDVANVMFIVINTDGKVAMINKKGLEILGYEENDVVGKNWFDNFLPESIQKNVKKVFNDLVTGKQPISRLREAYENPVLTKSGEQRLIQWHNNVISDEKGNIASTISSGIDVTDQRKAEAHAKQMSETFSTLFRQAPIGIGVARDNVILFVNDHMARMFGYENPDSLRGKHLKDVIPPQDHKKALKQIAESQRTGASAIPSEVISLRKDGTRFPSSIKYGQILLPDGPAQIAFMSDKTKEKEAQREIEHLASFPLLNPNPSIELNSRGNIIYANPASHALIKKSKRKKGVEVLLPNDIKKIVKQLASGKIDHAIEEITVSDMTFEEHVSWFDQTKTARIYGTDITERKHSEQVAHDSYNQLQQALSGTVSAVAALTESRDPYTAGHQRRVTQLADAIAAEMGLPKDRAEGLHVAASVHDIGKIHIPAEILSKPGRLNEMEYEIIKTHPQFGFDILKGVYFPWPVAKIVLDHHERLDGSGYPGGLKSKDLLQETKILSVADVVEAMSSHRPYRPSIGQEAALQEIQQNKGVLYDPEIVDTCVMLFTKKQFKFA